MQRNISVSIPKPCTENWANFSPATNGKFCGSCSKVVLDFTQMTDDDIVKFFHSDQTHTCGRFFKDQLKGYSFNESGSIRPGVTLLKAGFLSLFLLLLNKPASAQSAPVQAKKEFVNGNQEATLSNAVPLFNVKGKVTSVEDGSPLPGVNVVLKGTIIGTTTDADGGFQLDQVKEGNILIFSFIGLNSVEHTIVKQADDLEITLALDMKALDDLVIMGEVAVNNVSPPPTGFRRLWIKVKELF